MAENALIIILKDRCASAILQLLEGKRLTKREIFAKLEAYFGTDITDSREDDNIVRAHAGGVLSSLVAQGLIRNDSGLYFKAPSSQYLTNKELFLDTLHAAGGENFEYYSTGVIRRYLEKTGHRILRCEVLGGAADGGIDGAITTADGLGFYEDILIQSKCRDTNQVTEKEIREFYGAFTIKEGTRGIYATTSTFHECAVALMNSVDNLVGIDGERLFSLAQSTGYGMLDGKPDIYLLSHAKETF